MAETLSAEDQEFLARCEEELKDRYTEKDDDFMSVFNSDSSIPPVIDSWWAPSDRRQNDRRNNRRNHPYQRQGNHRDRGYNDRRDNRDNRDNRDSRDSHDRRGYSDYNSGHSRPQRHRYHY